MTNAASKWYAPSMRFLALSLAIGFLIGSSLRAEEEKKGRSVSMPAQTLSSSLRAFVLSPVKRVPDSLVPGEMVNVDFSLSAPDRQTRHEKVSAVRLFSVEQLPDGTDKVTLGVDAITANRLTELRNLPNSVISIKKASGK